MPPSRHPNDLAELVRRGRLRAAAQTALGGGAVTIVPGSEVNQDVALDLAQHEADPDAHPTYATDADLAAHVAAADPHPPYVKESEFTAKGDLLAGSGAGALVHQALGSGYLVPVPANASGLGWVQEEGVLEIVIDGATITPTVGTKLDIPLNFKGHWTGWWMLADIAGSAVIDLWKDTYANYPPTVADTITAAAKPTLASANKNQDTTLTGWTTAFDVGDTLRVNLDSATTLTRVTLGLKWRRD